MVSELHGCLASQHGLGGAGFQTLLGRYGSAEAVYGASVEELRALAPPIAPAQLDSVLRGPDLPAWHRLVEECGARGIRICAPGTSGYPAPLAALDAPPPLLYVRGEWRPQDGNAVAMVGTRGPTAYGREAAFTLARDFAAAGCTVVSGLALGVDAGAHAGALAGGGRSIAVIGCGLDIPYPLDNLELRERLERQGAVISEHPPGTEPRASYFPRRNRLISGLSRAVVVVEAGRKSGALLTADHARRQNKTVFAVPGSIFSPVSSGTNALLRAGALPAVSAREVLATIAAQGEGPPAAVPVPARKPARARRPGAEPPPCGDVPPGNPVLELWRGDEACGLDVLSERALERKLWPRERASAALLESLLQLELSGQVLRIPGPAYRRRLRP